MEKKKIPWNIIYLVATVIVLGVFIVANNQIQNVTEALAHLSPFYVVMAVLTLLGYCCLEGGTIAFLFRSIKQRTSLFSCIKIGIIGIYYSYITPSSTGGQPSQVAYFKRDNKIDIGVSAATLWIKFVCYQIALVTCAVVGLVFSFSSINQNSPEVVPFIFVGFFFNLFWLAVLLMVFSKRIFSKFIILIGKLIMKLKFLKKRESYVDSVNKFEIEFRDYAKMFRNNKRSIAVSIVLSFMQVILQMSVLYFVFRAFGNTSHSFFMVTSIQTVLQATVSFAPMPGASGVQEIAFTAFFDRYFTAEAIVAAILVWRFFTYYLLVISGAIIVVVDEIIFSRKKRKAEIKN